MANYLSISTLADSPFAQQYAIFPDGYAACHDIGVLVMHGLAGITDKARSIVAGGYLLGDPLAAITAKDHRDFNGI